MSITIEIHHDKKFTRVYEGKNRAYAVKLQRVLRSSGRNAVIFCRKGRK